ncbi:type II toxin-antitoxin system VapC family toxin [uncultured Jannaschia sp.]|uniref:type II toxin-antitoxin system VapC family toxin n=1 Tax=uncultured Jannaschia sp. TaxID=293347 RepID=UPI00262D9864|nr:type II toxin-antitoxin system VapC family toxin [uncultured Jannaschia sp.]
MSKVVLDASAVLAMLREEPGADLVATHIGRAAISAVNLQEVAKELLREGASVKTARAVLDELSLDVHPHDAEAAYSAAALYPQTKQHGRGLGDRACMALGVAMNVPVLTADREWRNVVVEGLQLEHVR